MSKPEGPVTPLGGGAFLLERADGTRVTAYAAIDGGKTWVFVDGVTYALEPVRHGRSAGGQDAAALAAPMPATVTQIHVTTGQSVTTGDLLVTLEAMKMELPIRAPGDGTVTAINCRVGELVQPGVPLIVVGKRDPQPLPDHEPAREHRKA